MEDFWLDFQLEDMGFLEVSLRKKEEYENENYEMKKWAHMVIWLSPNLHIYSLQNSLFIQNYLS